MKFYTGYTAAALVAMLCGQTAQATNTTDIPSHCEKPGPFCGQAVTHDVLFQFKPDVSKDDLLYITKHFFTLKTECVRPESGCPYLISVEGGKDQSIEGLNECITHGFTVKLPSLADRDYYVNIDPAHQAFKTLVKDKLVKTITVDYQNKVF